MEKISVCYCFGMLSSKRSLLCSKRSLDQRSDLVWQGQNEGICPISQ